MVDGKWKQEWRRRSPIRQKKSELYVTRKPADSCVCSIGGFLHIRNQAMPEVTAPGTRYPEVSIAVLEAKTNFQ